MSVRSRVVLILAVSFGLLTQFNNCADPLPDLQNYQTQSSTSGLSVSLYPESVLANQTSQISVSGGTAPYTYNVTAGSANVSSDGLITGLAVSAVTVEIKDSAGNVGYVSLTVSAPLSGQTCTTPWGQVVADGAQVTGYASANVSCPETCTAQTVTCNNGVWSSTFSATSSSCAVKSCVYVKKAAGICPNLGSLTIGAPSGCDAADYGKYICARVGAALVEYQCSSP